MSNKRRRLHLDRHPDIEVEYDPSMVLASDVDWLFEYLRESIEDGVEYRSEETIRIGWADLLLRPGGQEILLILEPDWTGTIPINFIPGVTQTLLHLRLQKDVVDSVGLEEGISFPSVRHNAIVCDRVGSLTCGIMERDNPTGVDSGWFIGCGDPDHDHSAIPNLKRTSLYEIGCAVSEIIGYCALPPGVRVLLGHTFDISLSYRGDPLLIQEGSYLNKLLAGRESTN